MAYEIQACTEYIGDVQVISGNQKIGLRQRKNIFNKS